MKTIRLFVLAVLFGGICCHAQEGVGYTISGELTRDSLRFSKQAITKLYLKCSVGGEEVVVDSTEVKDKKFIFKGKAPKFADIAAITGFDNGAIQLFLEAGDIRIAPFDGHFPMGAIVSGTPNNEVFSGYQRLMDKNNRDSRERMKAMMDALPEDVRNDAEKFFPHQYAAYHSNSLYYKIDAMKYLRQHLDSEASLYIIKQSLYYMFTPKVVERQLLRAVPLHLRKHPAYVGMMNQIKADNLKEGAPAPDISGFTPDGKELSLSDLQGKYVLLDFWASWCAPCRREFPYMKQVMEASEANDKFVILSYSIDSKMNEWTACIEKNGLTHQNWLHISTLKGWNTEAVKLFGVKGVPHTVLLNPRGEVIAFNLRGEEMVVKVKAIIDGLEKYE